MHSDKQPLEYIGRPPTAVWDWSRFLWSFCACGALGVAVCSCIVGNLGLVPLGMIILSGESPHLDWKLLTLRMACVLLVLLPPLSGVGSRASTVVMCSALTLLWVGWFGVLITIVIADPDAYLRWRGLLWYVGSSVPLVASTMLLALAVWRRWPGKR